MGNILNQKAKNGIQIWYSNLPIDTLWHYMHTILKEYGFTSLLPLDNPPEVAVVNPVWIYGNFHYIFLLPFVAKRCQPLESITLPGCQAIL